MRNNTDSPSVRPGAYANRIGMGVAPREVEMKCKRILK